MADMTGFLTALLEASVNFAFTAIYVGLLCAAVWCVLNAITKLWDRK